MRFLALDAGTTCVKAQVFDEKGNVVFYRLRECAPATVDGDKVVNIVAVIETVKEFIAQAATENDIDAVAVSSFGESFVLLDSCDNVISFPIPYTDPRGAEQAQELSGKLGKDKIYGITGTVPHAMYSISKLRWLKQNRPKIYERAQKLMLIGDYIGYVLTGERVIDYSLASRSGAFDIREKRFSSIICDADELKLFSSPQPTGSIAGLLRPQIAQESGLKPSCRVVLGSHDQICAAIGAGVIQKGQSADGMGTVECITAVCDKQVTDAEFGSMGYCIVPFLHNLYCTYILNYTSGAAVNWYRNAILHGYSGDKSDQFAYLEGSERPTNVLCLPYFAGCATPYNDLRAAGALLNLTTETKDTDIYRAVLEGTSYEMKLNLDIAQKFGIKADGLVATGGGANSPLWLQIKADITGLPVKTTQSSEGGLCGAAMLCAVATGVCSNLEQARDVFVRYRDKEFLPQDTFSDVYKIKYEKYKKLYRILKEIN